MKMHTLKKVYESLRDEKFEIHLSDELIAEAVKPIRKMLELSA
jgi:quinolinate synthase